MISVTRPLEKAQTFASVFYHSEQGVRWKRNHNQYQDLAGKTALVTGGTKGIGKAIADRLIQAGAQVLITARHQPEEPHSTHQFLEADLTQPQQVDQLAQTIYDTFGGLDILIDNMGGVTAPRGGFSRLTDQDWEQELQLNLLATIRLDRALLPAMLAKKAGSLFIFRRWRVYGPYGRTIWCMPCPKRG